MVMTVLPIHLLAAILLFGCREETFIYEYLITHFLSNVTKKHALNGTFCVASLPSCNLTAAGMAERVLSPDGCLFCWQLC